MKVAERRWGEVSIKKQGQKKNQFDKTRSFSIVQTRNHYDIDQLKEVLELTINLTEVYEVDELNMKLKAMMLRIELEG